MSAPSMFNRILVPIDNSRYSHLCLELAMSLAERYGATIVGFHVYAARLHEGRFRQLETSLPQRYHEPGVLEKQRQVHASLILKGLEIISRSYLEKCAARCRERGVAFEWKIAEGKNYIEIAKEANNGYDLVVMGAKGLGEEGGQGVGGTCLRAVRRLTQVDTLVVKDSAFLGDSLVVALDGSFSSQRAFRLALSLAKAFGAKVKAVVTVDTGFHSRVFKNLVGVLSEEAGKLFHFQDQERLHQEVIDQGMTNLVQDHLNWAEELALQEGVTFQGKVLHGKAASALVRHTRMRRSGLLLAGRFGTHQVDGMDLGSTVEAVLLYSPCNLLIVGNGVCWSQEASEMLDRVPNGVAREFTSQRVEEMARRRGQAIITPDQVQAKYAQWERGSAEAKSELAWTPQAQERMQRVPEFVRAMVAKSIEGYARMKGVMEVTSQLVDEAKSYWEETGNFHS